MNDDLNPECPFCQYASPQYTASLSIDDAVVNGRRVIYDRSRPVMCFEPLNPVTPGHMLFAPTWHAQHRNAVGLAAAMRSAYDYATARELDFNLITSSGPDATQTIPHIHCHYVPRRPDDGLHLPWTGRTR